MKKNQLVVLTLLVTLIVPFNAALDSLAAAQVAQSKVNPSIDDICVGITLGFLEHPFTCLAFILCIFELPDIINCPNHTPVYDPSRQQCVEGNPLTCEIFGPSPPTLPPSTIPPTIPPPPPITITPPTITTVPTTVPTTPSTTTASPTFPPIGTTTTDGPPTVVPVPPPFELCRGNNLRFIPDPSSCYRYYYCLFGVPLPGECDIDRIFHERLRGCVVGDRQTCTRFRNIDIEVSTRGIN